ncbi:MAG: endonuclease/exonuclease/phosphatase family protein [Gemmatimonadetes bacterium]|nr:endonuclease/exonuclease/phosphatase family protein [Gemmatimonadota bacterium]
MSLRTLFHERRAASLGRIALGLLAAATVFGFAGGLWWAFDLFAHFRPQYVVAGLLLALMLALLRQARWAAAGLAIAAVNALPIVPLYLQSAEAARPASGGALRVMSFNIFGLNRDHDSMLRYVQRERPDVLILLEVSPEWIPAVRRLAAEYPHQWVNAGSDVTGIAMMSRERPIAGGMIDLAHQGVPSYVLTFRQGRDRISVLGTHLNWPLGARATQVRNAQLDAIAALARAHAHPLVVMGDLNITPFSAHFPKTLRAGGLQRCVPGAGLTPTWPAHFAPLYIQIDHCLASAEVRAWNFRVGEYLGSDHYPIVVDVAAFSPEIPPVSTNLMPSSTLIASGLRRWRGT